jgi:hypothetical protein
MNLRSTLVRPVRGGVGNASRCPVVPMKELTVSERSRLRSMMSARQHPDRIEAYLAEHGYSPAEIEEVFAELNVRRSHLLDCYRMKRNVRIVGVLLIVGSVCFPVFNSSGTVILVSLGLLVYGIALAITGSFTVYQPYGPFQK